MHARSATTKRKCKNVSWIEKLVPESAALHRKGRITASNVHAIRNMRNTTSGAKVVKQILHGARNPSEVLV